MGPPVSEGERRGAVRAGEQSEPKRWAAGGNRDSSRGKVDPKPKGEFKCIFIFRNARKQKDFLENSK